MNARIKHKKALLTTGDLAKRWGYAHSTTIYRMYERNDPILPEPILREKKSRTHLRFPRQRVLDAEKEFGIQPVEDV
nr:hypothetical protein 20 [bacterium]